jgi:probable rRNA maturation factor
MIDFFSETTFNLQNPEKVASWISVIISNENLEEGELSYIFCDDEYLHKLNVEFLKHDTLTDIISFDNSLGNQINGDIFISVERVKENASKFNTTFENELHRVIIHGVLHYCGYKDKTKKDADLMRAKENKALSLRDFL